MPYLLHAQPGYHASWPKFIPGLWRVCLSLGVLEVISHFACFYSYSVIQTIFIEYILCSIIWGFTVKKTKFLTLSTKHFNKKTDVKLIITYINKIWEVPWRKKKRTIFFRNYFGSDCKVRSLRMNNIPTEIKEPH